MGKGTWKPADHHEIPQKSEFAKAHPKLYKSTYKHVTTHKSGEEHVTAHRDIKEVGPIGSVARSDKRKWQGKS